MKIETDEYTVKFEDSDETKSAVFERLIAFYKKHESFSGEQIMQSDGPIIDATTVLSDIADDIIKFECEWID